MQISNYYERKNTFDYFLCQMNSAELMLACEELLKYSDFFTHPGSISHHHSFEGGLILHTLEVIDNALHIAQKFPTCDKDVLIAAALWHDLAKIWDYEKTAIGIWINGDYHGKIHHISGSMAEFTAVAAKYNVDRKTILAVQHCIISHHCTKEWGSPRRPESLEAIILHQADMLSANFPVFTKSL